MTKFAINVANLIDDSGVYFIFASVSLCCAIFTVLAVPETKGKSPEEMKAYFMPLKNEKEMPNSQDV